MAEHNSGTGSDAASTAKFVADINASNAQCDAGIAELYSGLNAANDAFLTGLKETLNLQPKSPSSPPPPAPVAQLHLSAASEQTKKRSAYGSDLGEYRERLRIPL